MSDFTRHHRGQTLPTADDRGERRVALPQGGHIVYDVDGNWVRTDHNPELLVIDDREKQKKGLLDHRGILHPSGQLYRGAVNYDGRYTTFAPFNDNDPRHPWNKKEFPDAR